MKNVSFRMQLILKIFTVLLTFDFGQTWPNTDKGELVAVAVVYRHGDRAPVKSFPNDQYFNLTYWPMGFGQLTKQGIRRQHRLGQWLRQRYKTFISDIYSPEEIYVYSSDMDRTLMSAAATLAGLYPPKDFQLWNNQLRWQPIPVHTKDIFEDDIFTEKRECRKFEYIREKLEEERYPAMEKKYSRLLQYISKKSGWKPVSIGKVKRMYSVFNTYRSYNASFLPEWANNLSQNTLEYIAAVVFNMPSYTTEIARLRTGPFFNYLFNYFDTFVNLSEDIRPKFIMISSHDSAVAAILGGMRSFKMRPVKFSETVIWELNKRRDGTFFVNVLYKKQDVLEKLNILGCDFDCDYDKLKENMSNVTVSIDQWKVECNDMNK